MTTEAEHTAANGWCPEPGWWHADDDQATEQEVSVLVAAFVRALQPETVVETGTYEGQTAEAIGRALRANGHGRLVTFEPNGPRSVRAAIRCRGLPVTVIHRASLDGIPEALLGMTVGFAWLDSDATIRAKELSALIPILEPGAVIGVHDTRPGRPPAVSLARLVAAGKLDAITLRTPRGVTFAQLRR